MISSPAIGASAASLRRKSQASLKAASLIALATLGVQALLPILLPALTVFNLPLLTVIFAALAIRTVVPAMLGAMLIGWAQDGLTHDPVGMLGIVYSILSYLVTTVSLYVKVSPAFVLGLGVAAAYLLHEILLFAMRLSLLGQDPRFDLGLWGALTVLHAGLGLLAYPVYRKLVGNA